MVASIGIISLLMGMKNNILSSFDKKAIHVANTREYVASLIPNLTQTSKVSNLVHTSVELVLQIANHKLSDMKFPDDLVAYFHQ